MNEVFQLIQEHHEWFYLITFVWAALEGETFVIFAGLAAQRGLISIYGLFLAAALGSMFGDQVMFFLGRKYARKIVHRFPKIVPKLQKVFTALENYSVSFILSYRFMYGVRNVSAIAIGMSQISWRHFAFWNMVASFVWSFCFCGAGYLFGDIMTRLGLGSAEESVGIEVRGFTLAVLALFVVFVAIRIWVARRQMRKEAAENTDAKE